MNKEREQIKRKNKYKFISMQTRGSEPFWEEREREKIKLFRFKIKKFNVNKKRTEKEKKQTE